MKTHSLIFLLLCGWTVGLSSLKGQSSFTIDQAIDYAQERNKEIKLSQLAVEDADAQILEYWASGIPTLNGTIDYNHFIQIPKTVVPAEIFGGPPGEFAELQFGVANTLNGQLTLNALIFDGSFIVGLRAQKMYKELRKRELLQTEQQVRVNVTKAFLNVLVADRTLEILQRNIENLRSNLAEAEASYQEGFVERLDVDRIQLSLQTLETEFEAARGNAWLAKNLLKFQMHYPINDDLEVEGKLEEIFPEAQAFEVDYDGEFDYNERIDYRIANKGLELSQVDIKRLQASYLPRITGFLNHSQQLQREDLFNDTQIPWIPSTLVGARLALPIFDGLDRTAKIQRAKVRREQTIQQIQQLESGIDMEITNARIQFDNAQRKLTNTKNNLDLSERIYETTQQKFDEGVGSSLEVKSAESDFYQAQASYVGALYDVLVAYVNLQNALGKI
jgi:outer membrane protein TolC